MLHLILKESLHRKFSFLLSLLAIITAVALFVSFFTTGEASKRETTRLMRDIGFNLRIIPKETDMNKFWARGFSEHTMPQDYVYRFASQEAVGLSYNHLLATLHKRVLWRGMEAILTGISSEVSPPDKPKPAMIFEIERGTVYVGSLLANTLNIRKGDTVEILGKPFTVARCLSESGSEDDIRIFGHLADVQGLLNMEGQVNEIKALECLCRNPSKDTFTILKEDLQRILPETKVIRISAIATAREKQRLMVEEYFAFILPFVLVVCGAWIGVLAMMNVRERQYEIGVMRALGYGSGQIASLFLGKAIVIGLLGAAVGFAVGTGLALGFGPDIFEVTAKAIKPLYRLLVWSLVAAPAFAALASFIPTMVAVTQDPAVTLREA